jgi:hypothetical protein
MESEISKQARSWMISTAAIIALVMPVAGMPADPATTANPVPLSNKWRLEFDGRAHMAGEIVFAITLDGVTTNVSTKIPKGKGENAVAKLVRDQLEIQAPANHFHIETDDGEDVLVKKKLGSGTDNFGLRLVSTSVTGLEIEIKKE